MRRIVICGTIFILALGSIVGCEERPGYPSVLTIAPVTAEKIDLGIIKTNGNNSYIPINIYGTPAAYADRILAAMDAFETVRSDLRVLSWSIEKIQAASVSNGYVCGIWVHHEPKFPSRP